MSRVMPSCRSPSGPMAGDGLAAGEPLADAGDAALSGDDVGEDLEDGPDVVGGLESRLLGRKAVDGSVRSWSWPCTTASRMAEGSSCDLRSMKPLARASMASRVVSVVIRGEPPFGVWRRRDALRGVSKAIDVFGRAAQGAVCLDLELVAALDRGRGVDHRLRPANGVGRVGGYLSAERLSLLRRAHRAATTRFTRPMRAASAASTGGR